MIIQDKKSFQMQQDAGIAFSI